MVEEAKVIDYATLSEDELKVHSKKAFEDGDWNLVKKLVNILNDKDKAAEKAKKDALVAALTEKTIFVKVLLDNIIGLTVAGQPPTNEQLSIIRADLKMLKGTELDGAEGVWFAYDFGEKREVGINPACRLIKSRKAKSEGGGSSSGKGSYVAGLPSSADMLKEVGSQVYIKEAQAAVIDKVETSLPSGMTYQQAYDLSTNGGWRNRVRMALGKATGRIS